MGNEGYDEVVTRCGWRWGEVRDGQRCVSIRVSEFNSGHWLAVVHLEPDNATRPFMTDLSEVKVSTSAALAELHRRTACRLSDGELCRLLNVGG